MSMTFAMPGPQTLLVLFPSLYLLASTGAGLDWWATFIAIFVWLMAREYRAAATARAHQEAVLEAIKAAKNALSEPSKDASAEDKSGP